jgi:hypothetical protein
MKTEQIECYETSAYKIQTLGNYPEENIQQTLFQSPIMMVFVYICPYKKKVHYTYAPTKLSSLHICPDKTISSGTCAMKKAQFKLIKLNPS